MSTTRKFKVGDRVRVIIHCFNEHDSIEFFNRCGVIHSFAGDRAYFVEFNEIYNARFFSEADLEFDSVTIFNELIDDYYGLVGH